MGTLTVYALKSALCLTVLYLPYAVLLRRETFFRLNRLALLSMLVLSLVLPLVVVTAAAPSLPENFREMGQSMGRIEVVTLPLVPAAAPAEKSGAAQWVVLAYWVGMLACLLFHTTQYVRMRRFIRRGCLWTHTDRHSGTTVYCHAAPVAAFSWMHSIVISAKEYEECGREILLHEQAHVDGRHSLDACLAAAVQVLQWFNPIVWLLAADLCDVHEYEADAAVLRQGLNARDYQLLLIKKAAGARRYSIANSLNHSNLKKRITMMLKKKSGLAARMKLLYLLPAAALALTAFAHPEVNHLTEELSDVKVTNLPAVLQALPSGLAAGNSEAPAAPAARIARANNLPADNADVHSRQPAPLSLSPRSAGENGIAQHPDSLAAAFSQLVRCISTGYSRREGSSASIRFEQEGGKYPLVVANGYVLPAEKLAQLIEPNVVTSLKFTMPEEAVKAWGSAGLNGVLEITFSKTPGTSVKDPGTTYFKKYSSVGGGKVAADSTQTAPSRPATVNDR